MLNDRELEAIRARNADCLKRVRTYAGGSVPPEFDVATLLREVGRLRARIAELGDPKAGATPDLSGWSAEENAEWESRYGPEAAARLRAANDRVWAIVQELRDTALAEGRDPYRDPMARRLSAALVGVDAGGFCELPHMSVEEEDACDRRHHARGGVVSTDAFALPSRAEIEASAPHTAWSATRAARMNNPGVQAGYQNAAQQDGRVQLRRRSPQEFRAWLLEHRDEHLAQGIPAEALDALIQAAHDREEPAS